jgi:predicted signal transduction protein with EAL and GGDEF domain
VSNLSLFDRNMPLTLSIGITEAVLEDDAVALIARADKALYQAKSAGRNCRRVVTADADAATAGVPENAAMGGMLMPPVRSSLLQ